MVITGHHHAQFFVSKEELLYELHIGDRSSKARWTARPKWGITISGATPGKAKYFLVVECSEECMVWDAFWSHIYVFKSGKKKAKLHEVVKREELKRSRESVFVGCGSVQHACCRWKCNYDLLHHLTSI